MNKNKTLQKVMAMALSIAVIISVTPFTAMASPGDPADPLYNTLDAFASSGVTKTDSTTVTVTGDVEIPVDTAMITIPSDVTLDIADGGSLTVQNSSSIGIYVNGTLTVSGSGVVNVQNSNDPAVFGISVNGGGNMTISSGGTVNVENPGGTGIRLNGGNMTISSGGMVNVENTGGTGIYVMGTSTLKLDASASDAVLNLNGNDLSLNSYYRPDGVIGINGTGKAKIVIGATAPLYTGDIFYPAGSNTAGTAAANTIYVWDAATNGWKDEGGGGGGGTGGGGSSSSSSSSSSSKRETPPEPVIAPMDNKSSGTLNTAINSAASATSNGKDLGVRLKNVSNFTKENAEAILKKAKSLGKKATVSSDVMSEDGKSVEVRVTLDPALINKTVKLDGYVRESQTQQTESRFKKHFDNKTAVVSLGQEGAFGQTAKIAARVNLSGFDSKNLYFYSYDRNTNTYKRIPQSAYRIDKNGYLHFETDNGGDIIISSGPLVKK